MDQRIEARSAQQPRFVLGYALAAVTAAALGAPADCFARVVIPAALVEGGHDSCFARKMITSPAKPSITLAAMSIWLMSSAARLPTAKGSGWPACAPARIAV